jgi:hypothetical protein
MPKRASVAAHSGQALPRSLPGRTGAARAGRLAFRIAGAADRGLGSTLRSIQRGTHRTTFIVCDSRQPYFIRRLQAFISAPARRPEPLRRTRLGERSCRPLGPGAICCCAAASACACCISTRRDSARQSRTGRHGSSGSRSPAQTLPPHSRQRMQNEKSSETSPRSGISSFSQNRSSRLVPAARSVSPAG